MMSDYFISAKDDVSGDYGYGAPRENCKSILGL